MTGDQDLVRIYTDGACIGNPGPGGWAAVLLWKEAERRMQGGETATTNNRMELTAAIKALEALKRPCRVELFSDSAYLINAFVEGWAKKWQTKSGARHNGDPVKNYDLWLRLFALDGAHHVTWKKVKGHSGDMYNSICDVMALEEAMKHKDRIG